MRLLKTNINPNAYSNEIGELKEIHTTIISPSAFTVLVLSTVFGIISLVILSPWSLIALSISAYIILGPRFTYISIHENGVVFKKRFSHLVLSFDAIEKVETRNVDLIGNLFRSEKRKTLSLDMYLKNHSCYSFGEKERLFRFLRYPRIPRFIGLLNASLIRNQINEKLRTASV